MSFNHKRQIDGCHNRQMGDKAKKARKKSSRSSSRHTFRQKYPTNEHESSFSAIKLIKTKTKRFPKQQLFDLGVLEETENGLEKNNLLPNLKKNAIE